MTSEPAPAPDLKINSAALATAIQLTTVRDKLAPRLFDLDSQKAGKLEKLK